MIKSENIKKLEKMITKKKAEIEKHDLEYRKAMKDHMKLIGKVSADNLEAFGKSFIKANPNLIERDLKLKQKLFTLELSLAHVKGGVI